MHRSSYRCSDSHVDFADTFEHSAGNWISFAIGNLSLDYLAADVVVVMATTTVMLILVATVVDNCFEIDIDNNGFVVEGAADDTVDVAVGTKQLVAQAVRMVYFCNMGRRHFPDHIVNY